MPYPNRSTFFTLVLFALTGGWILTGCQFTLSENQSNRFSRLDSNLTQLQNSLNTVPGDSLSYFAEQIEAELIQLKSSFRDTTDTLFISEDLPQYQEAQHYFNHLSSTLPVLQKDISFSKNQLEALLQDVEKGKIKPDQIDQFLSDEEKITADLIARGNDFKTILQSALNRYYSIQPKVEERL